MVGVVRWVFLSLCMISSVAQAKPRLFSSGGGMGGYYHSFLLKNESTGLNENQMATVRTVNNSGRVTDAEWVVNCNENFPQVVRPSGQSIALTLTDPPPSATQTDHELWWAVCRKVFEKYSKGSLGALALLRPGDTGSFTNVAGRKISFKVLPLGKAALVPSLVKIRLSEGATAGKEEVVFVYCSVPTVQWSDMKWPVELSDVVDETRRVGRARVMTSNAVYKVACKDGLQRPVAVADAALGAEQSAGPSVNQSQQSEGTKTAQSSGEGGADGFQTNQKLPGVATADIDTGRPVGTSEDQNQKSDGIKIAQSSGEGGVSASGGDHTSWRGTFLGQNENDVKKALAGHFSVGFEKSEALGGPAVTAMSDDKTCGTFTLKDDVVHSMSLNACFFSLNENMSDREFAQIILDHYGSENGIQSLEATEPGDFQKAFGVSVVYKGNTSHGEVLSIFKTMGSVVLNVDVQQKGEF